MTMHTQKSSTPTQTVLRRRAAVLAAGMGASVALGTGVALAASGSPAQQGDVFAVRTADSLSQTLRTQAESQQKEAVTKAAEAAVQKRAADKAAADRAKRAAAVNAPSPAGWIKPVDHYTKGSSFGISGTHWSNKHSGQDFTVPAGIPVKAVHTGTVVTAGWGGAYGNNVVIKHGEGAYTHYAHLSKINVRVGQAVNTGQEIGKSGSTGNSTGPHLHFETRTAPVYGHAVEPVTFMASRGVTL
jgi:murein DD-endopeptidase MepM/ murein hydrolase activator NlpD